MLDQIPFDLFMLALFTTSSDSLLPFAFLMQLNVLTIGTSGCYHVSEIICANADNMIYSRGCSVSAYDPYPCTPYLPSRVPTPEGPGGYHFGRPKQPGSAGRYGARTRISGMLC